MTEERLAELERLADAATVGPWDAIREVDHPERGAILVYAAPGGGFNCLAHPFTTHTGRVEARMDRLADADFCAKARTAIPELLAEVRRLREQVPH